MEGKNWRRNKKLIKVHSLIKMYEGESLKSSMGGNLPKFFIIKKVWHVANIGSYILIIKSY
jgi:hypothetical protein